MTTTTTQESYVVYALDPEPFPSESPVRRFNRFDLNDKNFATTVCLFITITSVVLICLFFLIGHTFIYILFIIILVVSIALTVVFWMRRPAFIFGLRPNTSVKFPNYALHVIPVQQNNNNNNPTVNDTNQGYYIYPYPTNIHPAPVYTQNKTNIQID